MNAVMHNMEVIQRTFLEVQESFSPSASITQLVQQAESYDSRFRSIAYEAMSMCVALEDLKKYEQLKSWLEFLGAAKEHATQIHVGLGWALAQEERDPLTLFKELEPMMRYRVLDGYGYYEGFFRKRKSILSQERPNFKDAVARSSYDQGLGRSIWYVHQGNITESKKLIGRFAVERQPDLWRGIGIAVAYVGGLTQEEQVKVLAEAGDSKANIIAGAVMTAVSRYIANTVTEEIQAICRLWTSFSLEELVSKYPYNLALPEQERAYVIWIDEIQKLYQ